MRLYIHGTQGIQIVFLQASEDVTIPHVSKTPRISFLALEGGYTPLCFRNGSLTPSPPCPSVALGLAFTIPISPICVAFLVASTSCMSKLNRKRLAKPRGTGLAVTSFRAEVA